MPFRENGDHYLNLFDKQLEIVNDMSRYLLVSGPRLCGKTIGICHKIIKHCRDVPHARVLILGQTITQNADGGAWSDLLIDGGAVEQWKKDGLVEMAIEPRIKNDTKKWQFDLRIPETGKVAEVILDSLNVEHEVKQKFFGKKYTLIWITQMDQVFKTRTPFDVMKECMRLFAPGQRDEHFQIIADVNPPDDGKDSWFYKHWWEFPLEEIKEDSSEQLRRAKLAEQKQIKRIMFTIDDNIFVDQARKDALYMSLHHDNNLLKRFYYGEYVRSSGVGFFREQWKPDIHKIGTINIIDGDSEEFLLPEPGCWEIIEGFDIGGANPAYVALEPVLIGDQLHIKQLAEIVVQGQNTALEEFAEMVLEKRKWIESLAGKKLMWSSYSDTSSWRYQNIAEASEAKAIYELSGKQIELRAVPKAKSLWKRHMIMLQRMLFQNRYFIDAHCEYTIRMFGAFSPNRHGHISATDPDKHAFDALRYAIAGRFYDELEDMLMLPTSGEGTTVAGDGSGIVEVGL